MPRGQARRVGHTKSRRGCQRCKDRKVKCDETRPTCGNCQRYGNVCNFTSIMPASSSNLGPLSSSSLTFDTQNQSTLSPNSLALTDTGRFSRQERLLELRLMHHYTLSTSQDAFLDNHDPEIRHLYTNVVPILALDHEFLMSAVFSVALLHLLKLDPSNSEYQRAHRRYYDIAVRRQRQAAKQMTSDNAEALCITATLLTFQALTVKTASSSYEAPSIFLDLSSSNGPLFTEAWRWISESNRIICLVKAEPNLRDFRVICFQPYPEIFPPNLEELFPELLGFSDSSEMLDEEMITMYKFCLGYVAYSVQCVEAEEHPSKIRRLLLAFGAMAPPRYKTLVREAVPRALVILAYHFAVLKAVDDVWWLRGIAEREIFGIQSILPERWQWAMAWPIRRLASSAAAAVPPV